MEILRHRILGNLGTGGLVGKALKSLGGGCLSRPDVDGQQVDIFLLRRRTPSSDGGSGPGDANGSTDCGRGVRRTFKAGVYGRLVPVGSAAALADAIREHFDDPRLLERKAKASLADRGRLSVNHSVASFSALIDCVLADSGFN